MTEHETDRTKTRVPGPVKWVGLGIVLGLGLVVLFPVLKTVLTWFLILGSLLGLLVWSMRGQDPDRDLVDAGLSRFGPAVDWVLDMVSAALDWVDRTVNGTDWRRPEDRD